jgi:4'-phosphopantetheinyl transferase
MTGGRVRLWHLSVARERSRYEFYRSVLDEQERERAARFRFDRDRSRFVIARGSLRCVLGRLTATNPHLVPLGAAEHGKPVLRPPVTGVHFNLSHSDDCVVHAVAGVPVGVDVESVRPAADLALMLRSFAPEERRWLLSVPGAQRDRAFFTLWTCKEAYLKALGYGLVKPLTAFAVDLTRATEPRILYDLDDGAAPVAWRLQLFEPAPETVGCVAVPAAAGEVELRACDGTLFLDP